MGQLTEARRQLAEAQAKMDHILAGIAEAERIAQECRVQAEYMIGDVAGEIDNGGRLAAAEAAHARLKREWAGQRGAVKNAEEAVERLELRRRLAEAEVADCKLALLDWHAKRRGERLRAVCDELASLVGELHQVENGRHVSRFRDAVQTIRSALASYDGLQRRVEAAQGNLAKLGE